MNKRNLSAILYFLAGILFFVDAILTKNYVYYGLAACFVALGCMYLKKDDSK